MKEFPKMVQRFIYLCMFGDRIWVSSSFIEKLAQLGQYRILVLTNRRANRKQIENHLKNSCLK